MMMVCCVCAYVRVAAETRIRDSTYIYIREHVIDIYTLGCRRVKEDTIYNVIDSSDGEGFFFFVFGDVPLYILYKREEPIYALHVWEGRCRKRTACNHACATGDAIYIYIMPIDFTAAMLGIVYRWGIKE